MPFLRGPGLIVIAALLWGMDGILRRSLHGLSPLSIIAWEHIAGFLLILPFFLRSKKQAFTLKEKMALIFVASLSSILGTLWFTSALLSTAFLPFSVVFLLQKLQPIFSIGGATLVLREKIDRRYAAWAGLALVAAFFVTFPKGQIDLVNGSAYAALLALGAAFAWGFSTPFSRYLLLRHTPTEVAGWRFLLASIIGIGAVSISKAADFPISSAQLAVLVLIALSTGMAALWIYYKGLQHTEAKITAILELIFPLTAIFIDIFLYRTVLDWTQYLAALVLIYAGWKVAKLNKA